jgi:hypothetical protein
VGPGRRRGWSLSSTCLCKHCMYLQGAGPSLESSASTCRDLRASPPPTPPPCISCISAITTLEAVYPFHDQGASSCCIFIRLCNYCVYMRGAGPALESLAMYNILVSWTQRFEMLATSKAASTRRSSALCVLGSYCVAKTKLLRFALAFLRFCLLLAFTQTLCLLLSASNPRRRSGLCVVPHLCKSAMQAAHPFDG